MRLTARLAFVAIIVGGAVRFWVFTRRGSLFLDEASLALNVLARDFGSLAAPLDWGQAAPVGFLWIVKALSSVLGSGEWVLRLWPFVAGVATVWFTWVVGRKTVGAPGAAFATVALACSLMAIRYSAEVKPYATDALVALALVWAAIKVDERPEHHVRWYVFGVAGMAGLLLSLPAAFVLAAAGLALYRSAWAGDEQARSALAASIVAWLVTFGALWVGTLQDAAGGAYLREYWAPVMLDPTAPDFAARLIRSLASVTATPLRWTGSIPLALLASATWVGAMFWLAQHRRGFIALLLAGPAVFGFGASLLGAYPMSDRLAYFAAPLALLLMGGALAAIVDRLTARLSERARDVATIGVVLVIGAGVGSDAMRIVRAPGSLEPTRELFRGVHTDAQRDRIPVYVFARATPAWAYATTDWRTPDRAHVDFYRQIAGRTDARGHENYQRAGAVSQGNVDALDWPLVSDSHSARKTELLGLAPGVRYRIAGSPSREGPSPGWAEKEAARIRGAANPTVWIVASHFFQGTPRDELRPLMKAVQESGLRVVEERRGGVNAVALRVVASMATADTATAPKRY
ncbi:MAG: glycosyltransferase family 39 protein [Gemmatimonadota bacterium]|nr:glycosyltransferase family 39 protein [Gemmatimonadota bacterium]